MIEAVVLIGVITGLAVFFMEAIIVLGLLFGLVVIAALPFVAIGVAVRAFQRRLRFRKALKMRVGTRSATV